MKRRLFGGVPQKAQSLRAILLPSLPPYDRGRLSVFGFQRCLPGLGRAIAGPGERVKSKRWLSDKLIALANEMIQ
jgi:hypothetical protein